MLRERLFRVVTNTIRALKLVWESSRRWTVASLVIVLLQGGVPVILLLLIGRMIDTVTAVATGNASIDEIAPLLILVALITFLDIALSAIAAVVREGQVLSVGDHVAKTIHAKSIEVDLDYFENHEYHDTLHRAQVEAPSRPPAIVDNLLSAVQNTILLVGILGLLATLNPITPIILLGSTLPIAFIRFYYARVMYDWQKRAAKSERRASYFNLVLTTEWFAKEVRLFNTGVVFTDRYDQLRNILRRERLALVTRRTRSELLMQFLTVAALFGAFGLVIRDVLTSAITIGQLVVAFQAFQRGQSAMKSLLGNVTSLYEHDLFLNDFYRFLSLDVNIKAPAHPLPVPMPMKQGICFEDVHFRYKQGTREILKGINLEIRAGEIVALVGANGAGKTTLIKLLCRLYDPTSGRITLDGHDLRDYNPVDLRSEITAVYQDFNMYQLTALENIWLGKIDTPLDRETVIAAARKSGADDVMLRLPNGYDTQLGNQFDAGQELSVGQWQMVALARAFLRNAQMIVLDEPTSALDARAESEILERFRQIVAGRSAILISHRLSTARMADRILVIDDGQIVETGSHDELIANGGLYAELYETQSKSYR